MYTSAPRTVLERIIRNSDRSVREWCEVFNDCAGAHREKTSLSERTLRRWMAGDVSGSRAAGSRRIAEQVWKLGFEVLISVPGPTEAEETPESVSDNLDQELTMSTDESARWIRRPGGVEPVVLDQLHADVRKYAADYLHKPPIRLVPKLTQLRREVFDIIDERRPRPRELGELYLIAGQACALLAHACADLGRTHDADTHARTACFAADYAESPPYGPTSPGFRPTSPTGERTTTAQRDTRSPALSRCTTRRPVYGWQASSRAPKPPPATTVTRWTRWTSR